MNPNDLYAVGSCQMQQILDRGVKVLSNNLQKCSAVGCS
jgi:hypothetical protein